MMQRYVIFDAKGAIVGAGMSRVVPPGAIIVPEDDTPIEALARSYVDPQLGIILRQPSSPVAQISGNVVRFSDCPKGTKIEVCDVIGDEVLFDYVTVNDLELVELQLVDGGDYQITSRAPWPYFPHIMRVQL